MSRPEEYRLGGLSPTHIAALEAITGGNGIPTTPPDTACSRSSNRPPTTTAGVTRRIQLRDGQKPAPLTVTRHRPPSTRTSRCTGKSRSAARPVPPQAR